MAKPGMRFTYHVISATVAGEGDKWVADDNGAWINQATGERFDRQKKEAGGSSDTYEQFDVLALDDKQSLMVMNPYTVTPVFPAPTHASNIVYHVGSAGFGSSIWSNKDALQQLQETTEPNRRIRKGQWRMGSGMTDAVTLFDFDSNNRSFYAYDLNTGLLIEYGIVGRSASTVKGTDETSNTGSSIMVAGAIVNARQLNIPWANEPDPEWVATLKSLTYETVSTFSMSGQTLPSTTLRSRYQVDERGNGYTKFTRRVIQADGPDMTAGQPMPFITSAARFDPLWVAPAALAKLQAGQVLDSDPYTQVTIRVEGVQQGPKGPYLVIHYANAAEESRCGYDLKTGCLVSSISFSQATHTQLTTTLAEMES